MSGVYEIGGQQQGISFKYLHLILHCLSSNCSGSNLTTSKRSLLIQTAQANPITLSKDGRVYWKKSLFLYCQTTSKSHSLTWSKAPSMTTEPSFPSQGAWVFQKDTRSLALWEASALLVLPLRSSFSSIDLKSRKYTT